MVFDAIEEEGGAAPYQKIQVKYSQGVLDMIKIIIGVAMMVMSYALLKMGFGALKDSRNHNQYGVENESLHKKFSYAFIGAGILLAVFGVSQIFGGIA